MMIAAELRGGNKPSLNEALGWIGSRVDDIYGAAIGRLEDVWIDPGTGAPRWLLVKEGRFGGRSTLVPFGDATAGAGHVWVPYERDVVREAPQIEPGAPLTQQVEATLRNHYAANAAAAVSQGARSAREPRGPQQQQPPQAPQQEPGGARATVRLAAQPPPAPEPAPVPPPRMPDRPPPPVNVPAREPQPEYGHESQPPPEQPQAYPYGAPEPAPQPYAYRQPPAAYPYQPPPQQQAPPPPPPAPDPLAILSSLPPGQMIEIELSGTLTISGQLRHVRIVPPEGGTGYPA